MPPAPHATLSVHALAAPEVLYGARSYGPAVDVWSAGCVAAELLEGSPLAAGASDIEQMARLVQALGSPTERDWPVGGATGRWSIPSSCHAPPATPRTALHCAWQELPSLPDYGKVRYAAMRPPPLRELLPNAPPDAIALVAALLSWNPAARLTAAEALAHPFLRRAGSDAASAVEDADDERRAHAYLAAAIRAAAAQR
jgi:serine/threonine protein kinase